MRIYSLTYIIHVTTQYSGNTVHVFTLRVHDMSSDCWSRTGAAEGREGGSVVKLFPLELDGTGRVRAGQFTKTKVD